MAETHVAQAAPPSRREAEEDDFNRWASMIAVDAEMRCVDAKRFLRNAIYGEELHQRQLSGTSELTDQQKADISQLVDKKVDGFANVAKQVGKLVAAYKEHDALVDDWIKKQAKQVMGERDYARTEKNERSWDGHEMKVRTVRGLVTQVKHITNVTLLPIDIPVFVIKQITSSLELRAQVSVPYHEQAKVDPEDTALLAANDRHAFFRKQYTEVLERLVKYQQQVKDNREKGYGPAV